jgi:hypothetical protein
MNNGIQASAFVDPSVALPSGTRISAFTRIKRGTCFGQDTSVAGFCSLGIGTEPGGETHWKGSRQG